MAGQGIDLIKVGNDWGVMLTVLSGHMIVRGSPSVGHESPDGCPVFARVSMGRGHF